MLQDNLGDNLSVTADGSFAFATSVADGAMYSVTVSTQPSSPSQTCTVVHGSGTIAGAGVSNVAITCMTNAFAVGGSVVGLLGSGLTLHNGTQDLVITQNGGFAFPTRGRQRKSVCGHRLGPAGRARAELRRRPAAAAPSAGRRSRPSPSTARRTSSRSAEPSPGSRVAA